MRALMSADDQLHGCDTPEQLVVSATVQTVLADGCWLQVPLSTSCSGCSQQDHCSSGVLAKALPKRQQLLWLAGSHALEVHQQVRISVTPKAVLQSALLVYLLPLLSFLAALLLTASWQWSELAQLLSALALAAGSLRLVHRIEARRADQLQVRLLPMIGEIPLRQQ
jgi:sigma-E factor negative regulatory protein RseC